MPINYLGNLGCSSRHEFLYGGHRYDEAYAAGDCSGRAGVQGIPVIVSNWAPR